MLLILLSVSSFAAAAPPKDLVKTQLLADVTSIKAGQPFKVALVLTMTPGWHVYWLNPGDGGLPTKATLELPAGLSATPFEFPTPATFDLPGGLTAYGYEDRATLIATVTPDSNYSAKESALTCKTSWLVCKDICLAGKAVPALSLPMGDGAPDHRDVFKVAAATMPGAAGSASAVGEISDDFELNPDGTAGKLAVVIQWKRDRPDKVAFFPPPAAGVNFAKPSVNSEPTRTTITTSFELLAGNKLPAGAVDSVLSWQSNGQTVGVNVPIHFESHTQTVK